MKKVKVTKKTRTTTPWYERPPLLFGAIAVVLLVGGILMAQLQSRGADQTPLGATPDSLLAAQAAAAADAALEQDDGSACILDLDSPLPEVSAGQLLPPLSAETIPDAARAREILRGARGLTAVEAADLPVKLDEGTFGFVALELLSTDDSSPAWGELPAQAASLREGLELHRDARGGMYLVGFVGRRIANLLGERGPDLSFEPMPEEAQPPWWQFWKKAPPADPPVLYAGSKITIYPDIQPEATCALVLPAQHVAVCEVKERGIPGARPIKIVEVTLK